MAAAKPPGSSGSSDATSVSTAKYPCRIARMMPSCSSAGPPSTAANPSNPRATGSASSLCTGRMRSSCLHAARMPIVMETRNASEPVEDVAPAHQHGCRDTDTGDDGHDESDGGDGGYDPLVQKSYLVVPDILANAGGVRFVLRVGTEQAALCVGRRTR